MFNDNLNMRALIQPSAGFLTGGTISLRSNNPFDAPLIDPNYLSNDFDVALMREGIKIAREVLTLPAFDGYIISPLTNSTTDDEIDEYVRDSALTFFHPVATCAMSPQNAKYGVVDPDLRLKGADGIRVVDASVLVRALVAFEVSMLAELFPALAIHPGWSYSSSCLRCCREGFGYH